MHAQPMIKELAHLFIGVKLMFFSVICKLLSLDLTTYIWPPGVLGIWGEWLFIFRELGSTGNYFQEIGEQAHSFGDLRSPAKSKKKSHLKGKAFILFDFLKIFGFWGETLQTPLEKSKCIYLLIWVGIGD